MIFMPAVKHLEEKKKALLKNAENPISTIIEQTTDNGEILSDREKDVIVGVVQGLTNKEIAEKLFIAPNTVMTHRRNIAKKLQIHTAAGLTIYAIVNQLVDLSNVKL
jgi:regulator of cell morphogenesis and NO signaling